DANQLRRPHSDEVGQRPVYAQYAIVLIVNNNKVGDRVEDFDPVSIRLVHSREQTRIFQCNRRMRRQSLEKIPVRLTQRRPQINQAKDSNQLSISTAQDRKSTR